MSKSVAKIDPNQQLAPIGEEIKKKSLQSALYYLISKEAFFGTLIQMIGIRFSRQVPTACITFNPKTTAFEILINEHFFCPRPLEERMAILHHEILHFTNKHLFRFSLDKMGGEEKMRFNIAADMAINQHIKGLPDGCVDVTKFTAKGKPFPTFRSAEEYYTLLDEHKEENKKQMGDGKNGSGGSPLDEHMWSELSEDQKKQIMEEARDVIKRTMEKTNYDFSTLPDTIKDLLNELEANIRGLNCKEILRRVIKKTVSSCDRSRTWNRPNKRYGTFAPGSKNGTLPNVEYYVDTSGSISHKEANEFLNIMGQFMKVGARNAFLNLWHTVLYHRKKYKHKQHVSPEAFQSGGTDINCVMAAIKKNKPDMACVLTDGFFGTSDIKTDTQIVWIISKGGDKNHTMKKHGITINLDDLK